MEPIDWILGYDTGISSKTIWAVMMGTKPSCSGAPHDPADFGRCYRLLKHFPEWRDRLHEVADEYPEWGPLIREWDKLERMYEAESPSGKAPRLFQFMQELHDEIMVAEGWVRTGPGSWTKGRTTQVNLSHK